MKLMRRFGLALATAALGVGAVGALAPAHADTNWPCSACAHMVRR